MEHITDTNIEQSQPTAVTIGNFDGLHMGHRALISLTKDFAKEENLKSVVFTFNPHPMFLLKNRVHSALVMAPEEKKYIIESLGVDTYIEYPFSLEFASMEPEKFANELIFDKLNCKVLIVGENYKFGRKQSGNYQLLKELGEKRGVKVIYVPSVLYENERVSSTRIRNCLIEKDIELANTLLTVPYFIIGQVAQGKKLGRTIGFPTINIVADPVKLFPPNGVYATKTIYDGKVYSGVTNIGINPTVNGTFKVIETYLFDFHKMVYGETIKTHFFKWIRSEQKFPSVEDLRQQMERDAKKAKEYFDSEEFDKWRKLY
ncbi:riboflavin biosynthesis protein RibF [Tyzzerella sp. An114]|uniref:bifunctional riboflavin kinase/FAD synthetase n=1 Tax=Tyzzerella sp. An114 TaxID=1965545 RepID=UPI000B454279|nr:bifunctional riboflavin kinase/FAD synthetase [Tyzzerella sp. An114]OUQ55864.1 riboflavin biosynthesis protein RibF [Tyzzerella sp. An114]